MRSLPVKMVCRTCGSEKVSSDAYAVWDYVTQEWVLATTFDKGGVCEPCDGETTIDEEPLEGDELTEALAHRTAIDNGWRPGDEDTAIEFCDANGLTPE